MSNNKIVPFEGMLKRINREFNDLKQKYENINITYENDGPITVFNQNRIKITVKPDNNTLEFTFNDSYPFKEPKMTINGRNSIHNCYRTHTPVLLHEYTRLFGKPCMCCETKLCPSNWSPMLRLDNIIDEYKINKKIKRYLISYEWLLKINEANKFILPDEMIKYIRDILLIMEHLPLKHP